MKTRKLILAGLITLGFSSSIFAKNDDGDNPGGFGIKGGIGVSTLSFGNPKDVSSIEFNNSDNSWKIGGLLGFTYEKRFGDVFALDVEALLGSKGVKRVMPYSFAGNDGKLTMKSNLFTVDVPVSAKFYIGDNVNFNIGPYFSYIWGGNIKAENVYNGNSQSKESDNWYGDKYKDANGELPMNRFDLGANIGVEFVSNKGFGVGARFQKGFLDLTNDNYAGTYNTGAGLVLPAGDDYVTNTGVQIYGIVRF